MDKDFLKKVDTDAFLGQFAGKALPVDGIDTMAGATVSSKAVIDAVNSFAPAEPAPVEEPAAEGKGGTVKAKGLTGSFDVTVDLNDDGTVANVKLGKSDSDNDAWFLGEVSKPAFLDQFIGKALPVDGIDTVAGATVSSKAVIDAVNSFAAAEPSPAEEPAEEPAPVEGEEKTVTARGLTGSFDVTVIIRDDGTIGAVTLGESDSKDDSYFLSYINNDDFLGQFVGRTLPVDGIDIVAGATISSKAVIDAVNSFAAAEEPAEAEEPAAAESKGGTVKASGLTGSFDVTVALNDDGTVAEVKLGETDSDMDKDFLKKVDTEEFLGQFVGKALPAEGIDAVSGATVSSKAVIDAVNSFAQGE